MGPHESPTRQPENQAPLRRRRSVPRPRTRRCLLKGCEEHFHPRRPRQRYCSERCRRAAREWSRWKAQQKYRATAVGKRKRNGQSCRYRERVKRRNQTPREEAVPEPPRVITQEFFRRPATVLAAMKGSFGSPGRPCRDSVRTNAGARWNAFGNGNGIGGRPDSKPAPADLEDSPDILIHRRDSIYIQPVPARTGRKCCAGPTRICWT